MMSDKTLKESILADIAAVGKAMTGEVHCGRCGHPSHDKGVCNWCLMPFIPTTKQKASVETEASYKQALSDVYDWLSMAELAATHEVGTFLLKRIMPVLLAVLRGDTTLALYRKPKAP